MKNFMIVGVFAVLLAGCTTPEPEKAPEVEPEQKIIPLSIALPA